MNLKRILSAVMATIMICSSFSLTAFADEAGEMTITDVAVEETAPAEDASAAEKVTDGSEAEEPLFVQLSTPEILDDFTSEPVEADVAPLAAAVTKTWTPATAGTETWVSAGNTVFEKAGGEASFVGGFSLDKNTQGFKVEQGGNFTIATDSNVPATVEIYAITGTSDTAQMTVSNGGKVINGVIPARKTLNNNVPTVELNTANTTYTITITGGNGNGYGIYQVVYTAEGGDTPPEVIKAEVTESGATGGTVKLDNGTDLNDASLEKDSPYSFTVTAPAGYTVKTVTYNGTDLTAAEGKYTFTAQSGNNVIAVTYEKAVVNYTATINVVGAPAGTPAPTVVGGEAVATATGYTVTAAEGTELTITPADAEGYTYETTGLSGGKVTLNSDVTVTITYTAVAKTYTATINVVGAPAGTPAPTVVGGEAVATDTGYTVTAAEGTELTITPAVVDGYTYETTGLAGGKVILNSDVTITITYTQTVTPAPTIEYPESTILAGMYKGTKSPYIKIVGTVETSSSQIRFDSDGYLSFIMADDGVAKFGTIAKNNGTGELFNENNESLGTIATGKEFNLTGGKYYVKATKDFKITKLEDYNLKITYNNTDVKHPYTISGTVKDTSTGAALSDVTVTLNLNNSTTLTATTGTDGKFSFTVEDLSVQPTLITAEKAGYTTSSENYPEALTGNTTTDLTLAEDSVSLVVTGKIVDEANAPIKGAYAKAVLSVNSLAKEYETGADGTYTITYLVPRSKIAAATVAIHAEATGYDNTTPADYGNATTADNESYSIAVPDITMKLTKEEPTPTPSAQTHNFTTDDMTAEKFFTISGNIKTGLNVTVGEDTYTKGLKTESSRGKISFTPSANGTLKIILDKAVDSVKVNGEVKTSAANVITMDVTAGTEYTIARNASEAHILYVEVTGSGGTVTPIDEYVLTVQLTPADAPNPTFAINGVLTTPASGDAATGTYTFKLAKKVTSIEVNADGYKMNKIAVDISAATTQAITLEKDTSARIKFVSADGNKISGLTIDGAKFDTIRNTERTYNVGRKLVIKGSSAVIKWEDDTGAENSREHFSILNNGTPQLSYIVPEEAVGKLVTVTFTTMADAKTKIGESANNMKPLTYGQYGFGDDKIRICHRGARQYVDYAFAQSTLGDLSNKYYDDTYNVVDQSGTMKTANQYGILSKGVPNNGSFVRFQLDTADNYGIQAGEKVSVIIDSTSGYEIYACDASGNKTGTAVSSASGKKVTHKLDPDKTYIIIPTTNETYLKSLRIFNPNNVMANLDATAESSDLSKVATQLGTVLGTGDANKNFAAINIGTVGELKTKGIGTAMDFGGAADDMSVFRIVSRLVIPASERDQVATYLSGIDSVGFDVYDADAYAQIEAANAKATGGSYSHYYNGAPVDGSITSVRDDIEASKLKIEFTGMANSAVRDLTADFENTASGADPSGMLVGELNSTKWYDVYVQTFIATNNKLTLVPFTEYADSTSTSHTICGIKDANVARTIDGTAK